MRKREKGLYLVGFGWAIAALGVFSPFGVILNGIVFLVGVAMQCYGFFKFLC